MLKTELEARVIEEMPSCIGCNQCMDACPVSKSSDLTIADLNAAVLSSDPPEGNVREFTLNCVQCGRCVPVCPPGVRRDLMVLLTKSKIRYYPSNYENYVRLKQPNPPGAAKAIYAIKKRTMKKTLGEFYEKLDTEDLKSAEVLFYPGCYIFNEICHKTTAILKYLHIDYEILAGYSTCCGWPQFLQGRIEMAEEFLENLWRLIQKISPKIIITSCAECFAALRKLKALKKADFEPLTTTDFFYQYRDQLPLKKVTEKTLTLHDSCHISRKYRKSEIPRKLVQLFGEMQEMENHHDDTMCCYYYNFENDELNLKNRMDRMEEASKVADVMVTDCITCFEVYKDKIKSKSVEIWDFNELVYHCIQIEKGNPSDLIKKTENVDLEGGSGEK